eukprot:scaffold34208_cov72-Phaeocystis_antarctica.AAC.1
MRSGRARCCPSRGATRRSTRSPQEARASSCPSATSHSTAPAVWCRTKGYCSLHQALTRPRCVYEQSYALVRS